MLIICFTVSYSLWMFVVNINSRTLVRRILVSFPGIGQNPRWHCRGTCIYIYTSIHTHTHRLYKWTKKERAQNPFEHVLVISGHEECNLCRFVTLSNLKDAKAEGGSLATGGLHQFGEDPIESNQVPFTLNSHWLKRREHELKLFEAVQWKWS